MSGIIRDTMTAAYAAVRAMWLGGAVRKPAPAVPLVRLPGSVRPITVSWSAPPE